MPSEDEIIANIEPADADVPEGDVPDGDLQSLEAKYRDQMRQIVTQKIEAPRSQLLPAMLAPKTGQIDLSPDFQKAEHLGHRAAFQADRVEY